MSTINTFGCNTCRYSDCTPESVGYGREYRCELVPLGRPHCPSESGKAVPHHCPFTNVTPESRARPRDDRFPDGFVPLAAASETP